MLRLCSSDKVSVNQKRPLTANFRQQLTGALRIPGVDTKDLQTKGTELWWEKEDGKEQSDAWKG